MKQLSIEEIGVVAGGDIGGATSNGAVAGGIAGGGAMVHLARGARLGMTAGIGFGAIGVIGGAFIGGGVAWVAYKVATI